MKAKTSAVFEEAWQQEPPRAGHELMPMPSRFDPDAWHAMNARDNQLVYDQIVHGVAANKFVYDFEISGSRVVGVSVVGARQLARYLGGIQHRIVASADKRGTLFVFTQYPSEYAHMHVTCATVPELADEPDGYRAVVEVRDLKTGNTIQVEAFEERIGYTKKGEPFQRPHYDKIAQSKAYRNAVLNLADQAALMVWKERCLKEGKSLNLDSDVLTAKRDAVLRYATQRGVKLDRTKLERLTMDEIAGLADAARESKDAFLMALDGVGLGAGTVINLKADAEPQDKPKGKGGGGGKAKAEPRPQRQREQQDQRPGQGAFDEGASQGQRRDDQQEQQDERGADAFRY